MYLLNPLLLLFYYSNISMFISLFFFTKEEAKGMYRKKLEVISQTLCGFKMLVRFFFFFKVKNVVKINRALLLPYLPRMLRLKIK
jgi:hypothetical protein